MRKHAPVILIFLLFVNFFTKSTFAQASSIYYVDAQKGNDSNTGKSQSSPWKTVTKVTSKTYLPGDKILFKRGQIWNGALWATSSGLSGKPITYGAYGTGAKPIISATKKGQFIWVQHSGNIWKSAKRENIVRMNNQRALLEKSIDRLDKPYEIYKNEQTGTGDLYVYSPSNPNTYYANNFDIGSDSSIFSIGNKQFIVIENLELIGGKYYGVTISGGGNATVRSNTIKYIYVTAVDIKDSSNNIIQENEITYGNSFGIKHDVKTEGLRPSNNKIIKNTVSHFLYSGIMFNGYSGTARTYNNVITDNISFKNGDGIYIHYTEKTLILRNTAYDNTSTESSGEGYGIAIQTGSENTIFGNNMYRNRRSGIEVWGGEQTVTNTQYGPSNGNKIQKNKIWENGEYGVHLSSTGFVDNTVVAYNAIYKNGKEAFLISNEGNTGTQLLNNTTYMNGGNTLFYYENSKPIIKK